MLGKAIGSAAIALTFCAAGPQSPPSPGQTRGRSVPGSVAQYFDTRKPTIISGIVDGISHTPESHVFIAIAGDDTEPTRELRWVVKGDTREALEQAGWKFGPGGTVEPGIKISARVYPARPNTRVVDTIVGASPEMLDMAKTGHVVHGIEIVLADGKRLYFGPAQ